MVNRSKPPRPIAARVRRPLTSEERKQVEHARRETEASKTEIIEAARKRLAASKAEAALLDDVLRQLREARRRHRVSLAEIQIRTGIDRSSLACLENGNQSPSTLATLCGVAKALGVTIEVRLIETPAETASTNGRR